MSAEGGVSGCRRGGWADHVPGNGTPHAKVAPAAPVMAPWPGAGPSVMNGGERVHAGGDDDIWEGARGARGVLLVVKSTQYLSIGMQLAVMCDHLLSDV